MAVTKEDVIKFIENMSVLELAEMVKELEEKFGVSAAAPVAVAAVAGPAAAAEAAEEKTEFDVILKAAGVKAEGPTAGGSFGGHGMREARTITIDFTQRGIGEIVTEGVTQPFVNQGIAHGKLGELALHGIHQRTLGEGVPRDHLHTFQPGSTL